MPRGRKRKNASFIPRPWIPNSSSEDEHNAEQPRLPELPHLPEQPLPHNGNKD